MWCFVGNLHPRTLLLPSVNKGTRQEEEERNLCPLQKGKVRVAAKSAMLRRASRGVRLISDHWGGVRIHPGVECSRVPSILIATKEL